MRIAAIERDPFEYHRDYAANHRWAVKWLNEHEDKFPRYCEDPNGTTKRVYGLFVQLRGSEHFRDNLLMFHLSLPPCCPDKNRYGNPVNLNQDSSGFQRETHKTYDGMRVLLSSKMKDTKLHTLVKRISFDDVPQSLKTITYGVERFKYKEAV